MAHFAQMIVIWVVTLCRIISFVGADVSVLPLHGD
jgi:hypothetical protein